MSDPSETEQQRFSAIYRTTIAHLARREHSRFELQQKLSKRFDSAESLINRALDKAAADGYLSDERFAEAYSRSRNNKGFGRERIANELMQKGVDATLIADALAQVQDTDNRALSHTWRKKFNHVPQDFKEKMKQIRFLRYRGFTQEEIERFFAHLEE